MLEIFSQKKLCLLHIPLKWQKSAKEGNFKMPHCFWPWSLLTQNLKKFNHWSITYYSVSARKIKILYVPDNWLMRCQSRWSRCLLQWSQDYHSNMATCYVSKDPSTVDLSKLISQVRSQTKVQKLHMPIQHIHKSLASINEKTFFYNNFSSIISQMKKQK